MKDYYHKGETMMLLQGYTLRLVRLFKLATDVLV